MSQAVFSASPLGALGGYISRPTKAVQSVSRRWDSGCGDLESGRPTSAANAVSAVGVVQLRFRAVGGKSRGKKSAYEDLICDVKTLSELQYSDIRIACAFERRIGQLRYRVPQDSWR
jgi:hypothetical protein